jgi:hypothetical protein
VLTLILGAAQFTFRLIFFYNGFSNLPLNLTMLRTAAVRVANSLPSASHNISNAVLKIKIALNLKFLCPEMTARDRDSSLLKVPGVPRSIRR